MYEDDRKLFAQAINEALAQSYNTMLSGCNEYIPRSKQHYRKMSKLLGGNVTPPRAQTLTVKPKMSIRKAIAIALIAALLLTGCAALIYREEVGGFIKRIFNYHDTLSYADYSGSPDKIERVYTLGYIPDGYELAESNIKPLQVTYEYTTADGNKIVFMQYVKSNIKHLYDNESGTEIFLNAIDTTVYYRYYESWYYYQWSDDDYAMSLELSFEPSEEILIDIINNIEMN